MCLITFTMFHIMRLSKSSWIMVINEGYNQPSMCGEFSAGYVLKDDIQLKLRRPTFNRLPEGSISNVTYIREIQGFLFVCLLPAATGLPQAYKLLFIISSSSSKVQKVQKFNIFDLTHTIQSCLVLKVRNSDLVSCLFTFS